jgi:hypothetical protein
VREVHVRHALAVAHRQRLEIARREDRGEVVVARGHELRAQRRVVRARERSVPRVRDEPRAQRVVDHEEALEELRALGPALDREEVDDLDEELRASARCLSDRPRELAQTRDESIVADAEQRAARDVADARGLEHDGARPALREAPVPREHRLGDEAVFGGPPRDHRRDPRSIREGQTARRQGREPPGASSLFGGGPADDREAGQVLVVRARHAGATLPQADRGAHVPTRPTIRQFQYLRCVTAKT